MDGRWTSGERNLERTTEIMNQRNDNVENNDVVTIEVSKSTYNFLKKACFAMNRAPADEAIKRLAVAYCMLSDKIDLTE